jgi:hypothetical protein
MVSFLLNTLECVIIYLNSVFSSVYIISEGWIEQVFSVFPFLVDLFAFTAVYFLVLISFYVLV